jgi:hypothetical protein
MGEIKSTWELVMERTRHLSLTPDEKSAQQTAEVQKRLRGLIHKYMDGALTLDELKAEWATLAGSQADDRLLREGLMDHLVLGQANRPLLVALDRLCGVATSALADLFENYAETLNVAAAERRRTLATELARRRGFSGSALVPNLEADAEWLRREAEIRQSFSERLARAKTL